MTFKVAKTESGTITAWGPNVEEFQPAIPENGAIEVLETLPVFPEGDPMHPPRLT